jgi:16S rRNA (guanine966-N2)-methyltransferase
VTVRRFDLCRRLTLLAAYANYFDLIFMDPPYRRRLVESTLDRLHESRALAQEALIVAEHHVDETFTPRGGFFKLEDQRRYGKTLVSFLTYML